MNINYLSVKEIEGILDKIFREISPEMDWYSFFPALNGYEYFIPDDHSDIEDHPYGCRGDDHAIAKKAVQIRLLHLKIIRIIERIIHINQEHAPLILDDNEHAGNHFAVELALFDIKYIELYADFLFSCDLKYEDYQTFDIIKIVKQWGFCPQIYYLLINRWFNQGDCAREDFDFLTYNGFNLNKKLITDSEFDFFINALEQFLRKAKFSYKELETNIFDLWRELTDEYIFPHNKEKAEALKARYQEIVERLQNSEPVAELQKTPAISAPPRKRYRI